MSRAACRRPLLFVRRSRPLFTLLASCRCAEERSFDCEQIHVEKCVYERPRSTHNDIAFILLRFQTLRLSAFRNAITPSSILFFFAFVRFFSAGKESSARVKERNYVFN